ncbi:interferon-related developmental regulator 2 isoform X1 [Diorhabda carinulata]|uniref:interferon-related developmental regulator 2 isoform X1 n=1 Tax=Diorhabda carinulata TaxID=1163345 RepID=UPI00259FFC56|nr:interferon-related developmental regulator 2 isoform X1 [Diorhabda carinulata]
MPKGKRKGRSDRRRYDGSFNSSDDESFMDNASIISNSSEIRSGEDGDDPEMLQEQLEEKLCENIDGLSQKSSQGRINCFETLTKAFIKKCMPVFIRDRYFTICDSIERSLKKGAAAEKIAAVELAAVICVQLGGEEATEEICRLLKPLLLTLICDNTVSPLVRSKCCVALGNITFLSGGEIGDVILLMQQFESIFSASYLKGDGTVPTISPDIGVLHASAIQAWNLLFTLLSPGNIGTMINNSKALPSLEKLSELLESPHLDVRLAAGEALSLIFELGREECDDFEENFALDVTENLKQLATDSHKYRAKKDRKQQRATFRDILQFIENDVVPELQIKFGKETLMLDSWVRRKQYEMLCNILGPSINVHLTDNDLLREIFEIIVPPPVATTPNQDQMNRYRKRLLNAANYKARTVSRARNRDKRSDF